MKFIENLCSVLARPRTLYAVKLGLAFPERSFLENGQVAFYFQ